MSIFGIIKQAAGKAGADVEASTEFLIHFLLGHSAQLTQAAAIAEVATGNAELVPLTQQAGAAAEAINTLQENHASLAQLVSTTADHVATIATTQGAASVASDAAIVASTAAALTGTPQ
jgi:hypothetical protein